MNGPSRRYLLAWSGLAIGGSLAACLATPEGQSASDGPAGTTRSPTASTTRTSRPETTEQRTTATETTTDPPTGLPLAERYQVDGGIIEFEDVGVDHSFMAVGSVHAYTESHPDRQYLVVSIRTTTPVVPGDFGVERNGESLGIEPIVLPSNSGRTFEGERLLVFPVRPAETRTAEITYGPADISRSVGPALREALEHRPTLRHVELPTIVAHEGGSGVRFVVENAGRREVDFVAVLTNRNHSDVYDPVSFRVPPGETVTHVAKISGSHPPEHWEFTREPSAVRCNACRYHYEYAG